MTDGKRAANSFEELRRKAEKLLQEQSVDASQYPADIPELIQELQVHQTELEIQNDELKRAQEEVGKLHREYEDLYEFAPCAYITLSPPYGLVQHCNLTGATLLGTERSNLTRKALSNFMTRKSREAFFSALQNARSGELQNEELELTREDGSTFWAWANIRIESGQDDGSEHWQVVLMDITMRKQAEQELVQAKQQAERANWYKADFLARMRHELFTPLNTLKGNVQLAKNAATATPAGDYLLRAESAAHHLTNLVEELLDFSHIENGSMELQNKQVNISEVLSQVSSFLYPLALEKGLELDFCVAPEVPQIFWGDGQRLGQVLVNLGANAVKFTPQGRVGVQIYKGLEENDQVQLCFAVQDTGVGISREYLDQVFEPFSQLEASSTRHYGGTGVGLTVCKRLVEMMQGSIRVESQVGSGSTFSFTVWVQSLGESAWQDQPRQEQDSLACSEQSILVADDDPINRKLLRTLLEKAEYTVNEARTGREVLDRIQQGPLPALLILDGYMPEMDGFTTATRIREMATANPDLASENFPVLGITGGKSREDRERCLQSGMNWYLQKPVNPENLYAAIAKWSGGKIQVHKMDICEDRSHLDQIPGLDWESGLKKLRGDQDAYLELLRDFAETYADVGTRLWQAKEQGHWQDLQIALHTLKGALGNIEARELRLLAERAEKALNQGKSPDLDKLLSDLEQGMHELITCITSLFAQDKQDTELAPVSPPNKTLDVEQVAPLLDRLQELLQMGDAQCKELVHRVRMYFDQTAWLSSFKVLEKQVNDYDFQEAVQTLESLSQKILDVQGY